MISSSKPVFVLSGMSGTGKSCILEDARSAGCRVFRSFSKLLLDTRMGNGVKLYEHLLTDCFMQAVHIQDFMRGSSENVSWVLERSIIDHYYFGVVKGKYVQTPTDVEDMNRKIKDYFSLITDNFTRELVIVDIWNQDRDWISRSLENEFRRQLVDSVDDYLMLQCGYKGYLFGRLNKLGIKFKRIKLFINDVKTEWTPEIRRQWIKETLV